VCDFAGYVYLGEKAPARSPDLISLVFFFGHVFLGDVSPLSNNEPDHSGFFQVISSEETQKPQLGMLTR